MAAAKRFIGANMSGKASWGSWGGCRGVKLKITRLDFLRGNRLPSDTSPCRGAAEWKDEARRQAPPALQTDRPPPVEVRALGPREADRHGEGRRRRGAQRQRHTRHARRA